MRVGYYQEDTHMKTLYKYQEALVRDILKELSAPSSKTVLAASPGAGKTFMTIEVLNRLLQKRPNLKILILAHGTKILRGQFFNEIIKHNTNFTKSEWESGQEWKDTSVTVAIPQSLTNKDSIPEFDLVVIDEAHHYYNADMVQRLLKVSRAKHQLLLTGTPSKFIYANKKDPKKPEFKILSMPMIDVMNTNPDQINELNIELAKTAYPFTKEDYVEFGGELKETVKYSKKDTRVSIHNLVKALYAHLANRHQKVRTKAIDNVLVNVENLSISRILSIFNRLEKTMIACHNIKQGEQVYEILSKMGVKCLLSHSGISNTDKDDRLESKNIKIFQEDKSYKILIVVGRGVLGLNYPELVNVVDMTGSMTIDRIYQLMSRAVRKHPANKKKLFVKMMSEEFSGWTPHLMAAVLSLTHREWYEKYDGRNFMSLPIPALVVGKPKKRRGKKDPDSTDDEPTRPPKLIEYLGVPALSWIDAYHRSNANYSTDRWTTLAKVREELTGEVLRRKIKDITENDLVKFIKTGTWNEEIYE